MTTALKNQTSGERTSQRHGLASVELAFVLPVMLILVLGTIEVCQRIFLRQSAVIVAYEGARSAVRSTSSSTDVLTRCQAMLTQRHVKGAVVTVTPEDLLTQPSGTQIRVRIEVPWASNSPTRFVLQDQGTISVDAYMLRE
jgi:Flp pilus assembly protein TadG